MKYILVIPDGMADVPIPELNGKTPMEVARKPFLNKLAEQGIVGVVNVTPPDIYPGSDAANMALLGYDPRRYYTGRGAVEAAAMGISMSANDIAFRLSLVETDGEKMLDYSAGHIHTEDARPLIELAAQKLCSHQMRMFPGVSYRHILLWFDGPTELVTFPPHEYRNTPLSEILPRGEQESRLKQMIYDSIELFDKLPYNRDRRNKGEPVANTLWPWSQGKAPDMPSFFRLRGKSGAVISAVDVVRGLGVLTGLDIIDVPGITGYYDTDYTAKAVYALQALHTHDFVCIHVEAPDEAGHAGNIDEKIRAIENIDSKIIGTLLDGLKSLDDYRMLVVPDHATPITTRGHLAMPVPYLLYDSKGKPGKVKAPYDERAAMEKVPHIEDGYRLLDELIK